MSCVICFSLHGSGSDPIKNTRGFSIAGKRTRREGNGEVGGAGGIEGGAGPGEEEKGTPLLLAFVA